MYKWYEVIYNGSEEFIDIIEDYIVDRFTYYRNDDENGSEVGFLVNAPTLVKIKGELIGLLMNEIGLVGCKYFNIEPHFDYFPKLNNKK